jgi:hypothetical protein
MSERFAKLHKVPEQPAARLLAMSNVKLTTKLSSRASASVSEIMAELEAVDAKIDMARLMSVALPPREAVWWACLAARDVFEADESERSLGLKSAEAWVFGPTPENRGKVQTAIDAGDPDDPAALVATAALYAPGNLGEGEEMKDIPAPPGIVANCTFGMNIQSLEIGTDPMARLDFLIDRAIDIARGGHGQIPQPEPEAVEEPSTDEGDV